MKKYNFDQIIERKNTDSLKYGALQEIFGTTDLNPLWVADMDFKTPDFIIDAIKERLEHPVLGYFDYRESYYDSIKWWTKNRHDFEIQKEWICFSPGIVPALGICVSVYTDKGDDVLVQPPVYHPFYYAIENQGRKSLLNPLIEKDGEFFMDFEDLETKLKKGVKLMLLCNPHNPVAKRWDKETLGKLAFLCKKYNCILVSDEIHADLTMPDFKHFPTAICTTNEDERANIITLMAPSKTFNMAGLATSEVIIPNPDLMKKFFHQIGDVLHIYTGNSLGAYALEAAYSPEGGVWVDELRDYLQENLNSMNDYLHSNFPKIKTYKHEATYLPWLDFSAYGLTHKELLRKLAFDCKLGLNDGTIFGKESENKMRINIALPKSELMKAIEQFKHL
ncbi:MAG: PatB family C-S lyase [Bacteroidales bacterium]